MECPLYFKHMNRWMDGLPGWKTGGSIYCINLYFAFHCAELAWYGTYC